MQRNFETCVWTEIPAAVIRFFKIYFEIRTFIFELESEIMLQNSVVYSVKCGSCLQLRMFRGDNSDIRHDSFIFPDFFIVADFFDNFFETNKIVMQAKESDKVAIHFFLSKFKNT